MNILYLQYEVYYDQFCGLAVTGLDPITVYFSLYSCYFELCEQSNAKRNTYLKDVFAAGHVVSETVFIIIMI